MFPAFLQRILSPGPGAPGNQSLRQQRRRNAFFILVLGILLLTGVLFITGMLSLSPAWETAILSFLILILLLLFLLGVRANRKLVAGLEASRNRLESQITRRDEFTSRLSHKLRTSLSNLTLINNLVHDSRCAVLPQ